MEIWVNNNLTNLVNWKFYSIGNLKIWVNKNLKSFGQLIIWKVWENCERDQWGRCLSKIWVNWATKRLSPSLQTPLIQPSTPQLIILRKGGQKSLKSMVFTNINLKTPMLHPSTPQTIILPSFPLLENAEELLSVSIRSGGGAMKEKWLSHNLFPPHSWPETLSPPHSFWITPQWYPQCHCHLSVSQISFWITPQCHFHFPFPTLPKSPPITIVATVIPRFVFLPCQNIFPLLWIIGGKGSRWYFDKLFGHSES